MKRYEIMVVGGPTIIALNWVAGSYVFVMYHEEIEIEHFKKLKDSDLVILTALENGEITAKNQLMMVKEMFRDYVGRDYLPRPWSLINVHEINHPKEINWNDILE